MDMLLNLVFFWNHIYVYYVLRYRVWLRALKRFSLVHRLDGI